MSGYSPASGIDFKTRLRWKLSAMTGPRKVSSDTSAAPLNAAGTERVGKQKYYGLDLLRGVAILGVVFCHYFSIVYVDRCWLDWGENGLVKFSQAPETLYHLAYLLRVGELGVALFFVLSGYCIQLSIFNPERPKFSVPEFYWRRFWRIYPPYLAVLLVFYFAIIGGDVGQFYSHLFFVHNFSRETLTGINTSFWSLPIEFQLYLLFPIALWMQKKLGPAMSFALICAITFLFHNILSDRFLSPTPELLRWRLPIAYWAFWFAGALLAQRHLNGKVLSRRPLLWVSILTPLLFASLYLRQIEIMIWWISTLYFCLCVEFFIRFDWEPYRRITWPLWITGICSYSLYLIHQPLQWMISRQILKVLGLEVDSRLLFIIALPVSTVLLVCLAHFMYRAIELPSIAAGKQLLPQARLYWQRIRQLKAGRGPAILRPGFGGDAVSKANPPA